MRGRRALSDDHAYPQTDQFVCKRAETVGLSFRKSILDGNILPNNVSQVAQAPLEGVSAGYHRGGRVDAQKSNRDFIGCLLRARREWPRRRSTAECGQQFPPSDGDRHAPLPREVRKGKDTTPRVCCPNSAAPGAGGAHDGHRLQRRAACSNSAPAKNCIRVIAITWRTQ